MASRKTKAGSTNSPDKKLPLNKSIPLGIQHVLAMFAGNITVPIIVAGVFGQTPEQKIFLIQMALFVAGVATIIQTVGYKEIGARLPIVQGTSFAFIPIMLPFKAAGLGAVFTAAFIGGIFQIFIGKVLKPIRHLFPPLVTGIVVLMIGFSLLKVGFMYAGGGGWLMNNKPEIFANTNHLTVAFTVFITIYYGLHGKYFTTLMLEHMPWVIAPDKFLPFFWLWINAIVAGLLNAVSKNSCIFSSLFIASFLSASAAPS